MQNKKILNYTLLRPLGKGGMAEVWYAENQIEKPAAVKILNDDLSRNAQIVERFRNEAKVTVKLNHPNIRQVYDYDEIDGRPCMVMEYLEGDDLAARMKRGEQFTDGQLRCWWNQIADALNYTHQQGVVHRDIKPSNIFVTDKGDVKLLDFGIAKVRDSITATTTGAMMGTLMYMSPEQVRDSKHIDAKTDLYSLAVSFVHICSGRVPYDRDTTDDYEIRKNIVEVPVDMTGVPQAWQEFLRPYLAKNPDERPALTAFPADASALSAVVTPAAESKAVSEETIVGDTPSAMEVPDEATVVETPSAQPELQPESKSKPQLESQPKSRKRKAWPWMVAASVVAVIGIVTAILLLRGCGSPSVTNEPVEEEVVDEATVVEEAPVVEEEVAVTEEASVVEGEVAVTEEAKVPEAVAKKKNIEAVKPVPAGYVDLGLSVYWKSSNEYNSSDDHGFYTYDDAKKKFGSRLPTKAQLVELKNKCTWTWNSNKKGYDVKGPNGNSIFLPAAGTRLCGGDVYYVGSGAYYWSSTPNGSENAWYLVFNSSGVNMNFYYRCNGQSVRLVQGK